MRGQTVLIFEAQYWEVPVHAQAMVSDWLVI